MSKDYRKADYKREDLYIEYCKLVDEPLKKQKFDKVIKDYFNLVIRHIYKSKITYYIKSCGLNLSLVKIPVQKMNVKPTQWIDYKATKEYWNEHFPNKSLAEVRDFFKSQNKPVPYKYLEKVDSLYKFNMSYAFAANYKFKLLRFKVVRGKPEEDTGSRGCSAYIRNPLRTIDFPLAETLKKITRESKIQKTNKKVDLTNTI